MPSRDALLEIDVGRGDDAHVDAGRPRFADRQDLPLLEEAQELRLDVERQVADLVEEDRAAGRGADDARLIGDRAGEAAAPVPEQLAVGQLARRAGAVVGEEHRFAARRAGVDRARDQILAGAALAGDQHRQVAALEALDQIGDALHRGAGADEPGNQRLERPLDRAGDRLGRPLARGAELESLAQHGAQRAEPLQRRAARTAAPPRPPRSRGADPSRPIVSTAISGVDGRRRPIAPPRRPWRAPSRASQPAAATT